ncbi:MAG: molybdenum cofactor guanylyltransferase MobA [Lysobacteraceae bacterium]
MTLSIASTDITLGIFAGGRASRLGGIDKAWAVFQGQPLIERTVLAVSDDFAAILVSANRHADRYAALKLQAVADRLPDHPGPLAGLDAMLAICDTDWLLTVPVDVRNLPGNLVVRMCAADRNGAVAQDSDGLQPLVALWPVARSRVAVAQALAQGERAVHRVIEQLALSIVRFDDAHFGNLNTPDDFLE